MRGIKVSEDQRSFIFDGINWFHFVRRNSNQIPRNLHKNDEGKVICLSLHHYVWEKYNGTIPEGMHIHHIDHNPLNNLLENLQLISATDHASLHGSRNYHHGERPVKNDIEEIFPSIKEAIKKYNVSHTAIINSIRRGNKCCGHNWSYVYEKGYISP